MGRPRRKAAAPAGRARLTSPRPRPSGSLSSKAVEGSGRFTTTSSKRIVVWSPVGSVRRVCTGMDARLVHPEPDAGEQARGRPRLQVEDVGRRAAHLLLRPAA